MEGPDGLFVSRWKPFEASTRVPVGLHTDKLYLLLANHMTNMHSGLTQAEVMLEYADGDRVTVPLTAPHEIDSMVQHYSDLAPVWIGGEDQGWFGFGNAFGSHADITDIEVDPSRELAAFELRCVTRDTLVGLLAATAHRAPD
jgi:hypothetical protein